MAQPQPQQRGNTNPMESLQGTMNFLLTILGQTLNQPARLRDPQHRIKTQGVFPTANARFHEALDRMEQELNTAQAILRRDLALHRVLEKQEAAKAAAPKEAAMAPEQGDATRKKGEDEDVVMVDNLASGDSVKTDAPQDTTSAAQAASSTAQLDPVKPELQEPQTGNTSSKPTGDPTTTDEPNTTTSNDQTSPLLAGSANGEMDFSSIFGDDLGGVGDPNQPDDAPLDDTLVDFGDDSADVSALLPGLDSYANIPDGSGAGGGDTDNHMPDITSSSTDVAAADAIPGFNFDISQSDPTTTTTAPAQTQSTNTANAGDQTDQVDFGDIDFNVSFDDAGTGSGGGDGLGGGDTGDNTFNDLFDLEDYHFSGDVSGGGGAATGSGSGKGGMGQDIEDFFGSFN